MNMNCKATIFAVLSLFPIVTLAGPSFNPPIYTPYVAYVEQTGNDSSGVVGLEAQAKAFPFATFSGAYNATAASGTPCLISMGVGVWNESIPLKSILKPGPIISTPLSFISGSIHFGAIEVSSTGTASALNTRGALLFGAGITNGPAQVTNVSGTTITVSFPLAGGSFNTTGTSLMTEVSGTTAAALSTTIYLRGVGPDLTSLFLSYATTSTSALYPLIQGQTFNIYDEGYRSCNITGTGGCIDSINSLHVTGTNGDLNVYYCYGNFTGGGIGNGAILGGNINAFGSLGLFYSGNFTLGSLLGNVTLTDCDIVASPFSSNDGSGVLTITNCRYLSLIGNYNAGLNDISIAGQPCIQTNFTTSFYDSSLVPCPSSNTFVTTGTIP